MPRRNALKEWSTAAPFLAPNFLGFLLFTLMPVGVSMVLSFYQYDNITPAKFVGTANYHRLVVDPKFWSSLGNTLFMMLGLPLTMFGALLLALALNSKIYGRIALRTIYYLPSISPLIAVAVVWMWIYNPEQGLFNSALQSIGLRGPNWLGDITWAKPAFIFMGIWSGIGGFTMLLYLAALQDIPRSYYEAAHLDGAGALAALLVYHLASAGPGQLLHHRDGNHRRLPGLRLAICHDQRWPGRFDHHHRPLHLQ